MVEVKREDGETIDKLIRRYSDKLKRTRTFNRIKSGAARTKEPNRRSRKISALYKLRKRQKMEYLKRIGKIDDKDGEMWYRNAA